MIRTLASSLGEQALLNQIASMKSDLVQRAGDSYRRGHDYIEDRYIVALHDYAFPYGENVGPEGTFQRINHVGETIDYWAHNVVSAAGGELGDVWNLVIRGF